MQRQIFKQETWDLDISCTYKLMLGHKLRTSINFSAGNRTFYGLANGKMRIESTQQLEAQSVTPNEIVEPACFWHNGLSWLLVTQNNHLGQNKKKHWVLICKDSNMILRYWKPCNEYIPTPMLCFVLAFNVLKASDTIRWKPPKQLVSLLHLISLWSGLLPILSWNSVGPKRPTQCEDTK